MTNTIVKAAMEDLIWVVIGLFWLVAQIAGAAAKKKQPPRPRPSRPPEKSDDDPFADLMRQLGGAPKFEPPKPEEELRFEEEPVATPWQPEPVAHTVQTDFDPYGRDDEALPDIEPIHSAASIEEANVEPIQEIASIPVPKKMTEDLPDETMRPKMSHFRSGIPVIKMPSIPSMNLTVDVPSYSEASTGRQGIGRELRLQNRRSLRKAMLSHLIFSKPRALDRSDPSKGMFS